MNFNRVDRVWSVLGRFDVARRAYERVRARPIMHAENIARNVICLLLLLETINGVKVLHKVSRMAPDGIWLSQVATEADALYMYVIHGDDSRLPPAHVVVDDEAIPAIADLCGGRRRRLVDFGFFQFHKALVARGMAVIQNTVATLVFNDDLHAALRQFEEDVDTVGNPKPPAELLALFVPRWRTPPEDSRTVFVSFPECPPLSAEQIVDYFERHLRFGVCIERIEIEQHPRAGQPPKHGIIVFMTGELRDEVACGETAVVFRVAHGHDMWVQHYQPDY